MEPTQEAPATSNISVRSGEPLVVVEISCEVQRGLREDAGPRMLGGRLGGVDGEQQEAQVLLVPNPGAVE